MIKYSIIIPHKNIPKLLQRCLDSVPIRDDVQVIVVDDKSDSDKVNFDNFPGIGRPNTEVYFTKEDKGAGYARNFGLDHAIGKWLVFLDADDFLSENTWKILDDNINSPYDLIFYDNNTVMSDDVSLRSTRDSVYHSYLMDYLKYGKNEDDLRYSFQPLWGKIIRHSVVKENNIRFDEVRWSNDVLFSCKVGYYAKSFHVENEVLYVVTQRAGSLTSKFCGTGDEFRVRLNEALKAESFLNGKGVSLNRYQSKSLIVNYYRNHGIKGLLGQAMSVRIFSKSQYCMFSFILRELKGRIQ